jgi:hypothetical protein
MGKLVFRWRRGNKKTMKITVAYSEKNTITIELDAKINLQSSVMELNNTIKSEITSLVKKEKLPNNIDYIFQVNDYYIDPLTKRTLKESFFQNNGHISLITPLCPFLSQYYSTLHKPKEDRVLKILEKNYMIKRVTHSTHIYHEGFIALLNGVYDSYDTREYRYTFCNKNISSLKALEHYILNPRYTPFFTASDYFDKNFKILLSLFGSLRHPSLQKIFSKLITTTDMLIQAANIAYSDDENALAFFLKDNPNLNKLALPSNKILTRELQQIFSSLPITSLIIEHMDQNAWWPEPFGPYPFFLKRNSFDYMSPMTDQDCIIRRGKVSQPIIFFFPNKNLTEDKRKSLASFSSKLENLRITGIIRYSSCTVRKRNGIIPDMDQQNDINRCELNYDNHIYLQSPLGKKIGIMLAIERGLLKGATADKLLGHLEKLEAPIEFVQASLMIAWYRYHKQTAILSLLPLISEFLGDKTAWDTFSFIRSATFKTLSNSKIISPKNYKERSEKLREYAYKDDPRLWSQEILSKIDHAEIKTESFVAYQIFSKINQKSKEPEMVVKENDDFMEGINRLRSS